MRLWGNKKKCAEVTSNVSSDLFVRDAQIKEFMRYFGYAPLSTQRKEKPDLEQRFNLLYVCEDIGSGIEETGIENAVQDVLLNIFNTAKRYRYPGQYDRSELAEEHGELVKTFERMQQCAAVFHPERKVLPLPAALRELGKKHEVPFINHESVGRIEGRAIEPQPQFTQAAE